ncbi:MAG: hypothetical protein CSA95_00360 [Bacteroidetes bacterium]|nr:MAG: hypothetical protein CSA95_00360 [Bacteroidota bacterium]
MRFVWFVCVMVVCGGAGAQVLQLEGTRASACGGCVSVMDGPESAFDNPAALARQEGGCLFLDAQNDYLLPSLTCVAVGSAVAASHTNLSLCVAYFGDAFFHETTLSLGGARCLFRTLLMGVRINYHHLSQGEAYARRHYATSDVGWIWVFSDRVALGLYWANPFFISFRSESPLSGSSGVSAGMLFHAGPHVLVVAELERRAQRTLNLKGGMEWVLSNSFTFRCGFQHATRTLSLGCGLLFQRIKVNLLVSNSLFPGPHVGMGFLYEWIKG